MSSVQQCDQKCPECGEESGTYDLDCRTNEEWFICESCGWGFESTTRRFGAKTLDELRRAVAGSDPSERWPLIKSILKSLLGECREHGYTEDDSAVQQLQAWLKKEATVVTEADWKGLKALSCHRSLFALDKGNVIFDYVEQAPRIVSIPISELRPMSELDALVDQPRDESSET
jgi:hypothetical protein